MKQPRDFAPLIGKMVVSGKTLEGDELADYLQNMPPCDFESLLQDMATVGIHEPQEE